MKVTSITQNRPAKRQKTSVSHGTFKGKIKMRKYLPKKYDSMSATQHQQLYELWRTARLIKGKKTPESSKVLEARVVALEAKSDNSD